MAHMMKHTKASCGHMFAHYDRKADNISNENVDRTRTHLNYNLATHQTMEQGEFVRQRCSEVRCQNRKDINVMVSWVITVPKDLPEQELKAFFQSCYDFCVKRYGLENVVSAYVHMDEVTPHMHFAFVPVKHTFKEDKKNPNISTEVRKVSAKEVVNRNDLQTFHESLQRYVSRELGHEVSILNEATKEGNKSISELKRQSATERLQEATEKASRIVSEAQKEAEGIEASVNILKTEKTALQDDIKVLQTEKEKLTSAEVEAIKAEKTVFGGLKGVSHKEFEAVRRTASVVDQAIAQKELAMAQAKAANEAAAKAKAEADLRVQQAYADANRQLDMLRKQDRAELEREKENLPSFETQRELLTLKKRVNELETELDRMLYGISVKRTKLERFIGVLPGQFGEEFFVESINKATGMDFSHSSEIVKYVSNLESEIEKTNKKIKVHEQVK